MYLNTLGYPEEVLDKLNDHQVHTLYQSIQENSNGKIVEYAGSETQILSFNESGALIDTPQTRGTISESDLNITAIYTNYVEADWSMDISSVEVYIAYNWLNTPVVRNRDAITINWDSSLFNYIGFAAYACTLVNGQNVDIETITTPALLNSGGLGFDIPLSYAHYPSFNSYGEALLFFIPNFNRVSHTVSPISLQYTHYLGDVSIDFGFAGLGVSVSTNNADTRGFMFYYSSDNNYAVE